MPSLDIQTENDLFYILGIGPFGQSKLETLTFPAILRELYTDVLSVGDMERSEGLLLKLLSVPQRFTQDEQITIRDFIRTRFASPEVLKLLKE